MNEQALASRLDAFETRLEELEQIVSPHTDEAYDAHEIADSVQVVLDEMAAIFALGDELDDNYHDRLADLEDEFQDLLERLEREEELDSEEFSRLALSDQASESFVESHDHDPSFAAAGRELPAATDGAASSHRATSASPLSPEQLPSTNAKPFLKGLHQDHHMTLERLLKRDALGCSDIAQQDSDMLQPLEAAVCRSFSIVSALRMPVNDGPEPSRRLVRVALYNRSQFIGNVLTVYGTMKSKKSSTWPFDKAATDVLTHARDSDGFCLVRCSETPSEIELIFELAQVEVAQGSAAPKEVSKGWARLPLRTSTGHPATSGIYDLELFRGTPASPAGPVTGTRTSKRKQPRLRIRLANLKKSVEDVCNHLPTTVLLQLSSVWFVRLYRQIQLKTLFRSGADLVALNDLVRASRPALNVFLRIAEDPQLLYTFRTLWDSGLKKLKPSLRKDIEHVEQWFQTLLETRMLPILLLQSARYLRHTEPFLSDKQQGAIDSALGIEPLELLLSARHRFSPVSSTAVVSDPLSGLLQSST